MIKKFAACFMILISTWAFAKPMFFYIPSKQKIFYFQLDANPTTGYQWQIKVYDKKILRFVKSKYMHSTPRLIGSGGKMRFYFETLNSDVDTVIYLTYSRPWEKTAAYSKEVHIKSK
jgi:inhibitor of cysteine peptidase